jgi:hypothetical protein
MGVMKNLSIEAYRAFRKWEDEKYGDKTPLADMHVDLWIEGYMMGYAQAKLNEESEDEVA